MSAALELIRNVEAAGGRLRVEGESLIITPRRAVEPFLDQLRTHKPEILALLQARAGDPETWRGRFVSWAVERCELREDCEDWQSVASLLIDFAEWCAAHNADAPRRGPFEALLRDAGIPLKDSLAAGIVLKADLEAVCNG